MARLTVKGIDSNNDQYKQISFSQVEEEEFLSLQDLANMLGRELSIQRNQQGEVHVEFGCPVAGDNFVSVSDEIIETLTDSIATDINRLSEVNQEIFNNPEMGNEEHHAATTIISYLKSKGLDVEVGLNGIDPRTKENVFLKTAFKAVQRGKNAGPTITIMLEYDALPMGHACGHNLIAVSGLAAVAGLHSLLDRLDGTLCVIGTPAEEGGRYGGKIPLLEAGHFDHSDIVLITHPGDRWDTGADFLAISGGRITFQGTPSHASAAPEKGVSALDAAILTYTSIETMREHVRSDARIHGIIKDGGKVSNIVPEQASLSYGVRALDQPYVEELIRKIENCAKAGALATGASVDVNWSFGYSSPINVTTLDKLVIFNAQGQKVEGMKKWEALGSSDLGNVGFEVPTCNLWFKIAAEGILPHTHEFMKASASEYAFKAAVTAGKILAISACQLFLNPSGVEQIKQEFNILKNQLQSG